MLVTRPPPCGAAMDRDEFADAVAVADAGLGALALVLQILRRDADGGVREEDVVLADPGGPFEEVVGHQARARADFDVRADDAVGADFGGLGNPRAGVHDGGGMDRTSSDLSARRHFSSLSASLHMTSASATTTPSTVATPAILATLALRLMTFISMRSVSPGTTGRRKRAFSMATSRTSLLARSSMLLSTRMPAVCAMASTISTPGITGKSGKWPWKNGSSLVTFLIPTMRSGSISTMRSTSRNGERCGRMARISLISRMAMEVAIIAAVDPILSYIQAQQPEIVALIRQFVECESPSDNPAAVNRFVELVSDTVAPFAKVKTIARRQVRASSSSAR